MTTIQNLPRTLTKDERKMLYENWNSESWKMLAERNIRFAIKYAKKFKNTGIDEDDLVGISFIGLTIAAKKFDPDLGYEFTTYAEPVIRNHILQEIRRMKYHPYPDISLNDILNNDGDEYERGEIIPDKIFVEDYILFEDSKRIANEIYCRKNMLKKKVILRFYGGKNQQEIGCELGISQSYVSRILKEFKNEIIKKTR